MGNSLSELWPSQHPAGSGPSLLQNASDVTVNGGTFNAVGGNQTNIFVHNTTTIQIHKSLSNNISSALSKIRRTLDHAKFPAIQQDTYARRIPDTGLWFMETDEFKEWWTTRGRILWATGMPGAGKTHIAACAINRTEEVAKTKLNVSVSYGYFQYSDPKPMVKVLQSLVRQQAEYCPAGAELVAATIAEREAMGLELSQSDCIALLKHMSELCDESFFYLDGLDEAPPDSQFDVIDMLSSIKNAHICIFSRPLDGMQRTLQENLHNVTFTQIIAHDQDIDLLVEQKINRTPEFVKLLGANPELKAEIVAKIKENAGGMFLHAALQIEVLRHSTSLSNLRSKLTRFPRGIEGMYVATLKRIDKQPEDLPDLAKRVLIWIAYAQRPLLVEELQYALATNVTTQTVDEDDLPPASQMISACCGLVIVNSKNELRLLHFTARDVVQRLLHDMFPFPHSMIANVCMTTLVVSGIVQSSIRTDQALRSALSKSPFMAYSYCKLLVHIRTGMGSEETPMRNQALAFFRKCRAFPLLLRRSYILICTPLHITAYSGLPDLIHPLVHEDRLDVNALSIKGTPYQWTPLIVASIAGTTDSLEYLLTAPGLDHNWASPADGWTALHWAAAWGSDRVVKTLLSHPEVNVNARSTVGRTPLMEAIVNDHPSTAYILLEDDGIDINIPSENGDVALMLALVRGYQEVALRVLEVEGVAVNVKDIGGRSPLIIAADRGYDAIVDKLLSVGVDPNHRDRRGRTALTWALRHGEVEVAHRLLDVEGIRVDIRDEYGRTPLIQAAMGGHRDVVARLLGRPGVDVNQKDKQGRSALAAALRKGHDQVAQQLLDFEGIDYMQKDDWARTPFIHAADAGCQEVVERMLGLEGIDINYIDKEGWSVLTSALRRGHTALAHRLLGVEGIEFDSHGGDKTRTALIHAAKRGQADVVERFLGMEGIDINHVDTSGWSALTYALRNGHMEVVKLLLDFHGIDEDVQGMIEQGRLLWKSSITQEVKDLVVHRLAEV